MITFELPTLNDADGCVYSFIVGNAGAAPGVLLQPQAGEFILLQTGSTSVATLQSTDIGAAITIIGVNGGNVFRWCILSITGIWT